MRDPLKRQAARNRYNRTERGKASRKRYLLTAKGKARLQRSEQRNRWPRSIMQFYGITVEEYAWLLYSQDFKCPICQDTLSKEVLPPKEQHLRPCVDHCHSTGSVRGIVCGWCNYKLIGPMERAGTTAVGRVVEYLASAERNAAALRRAIGEVSG